MENNLIEIPLEIPDIKTPNLDKIGRWKWLKAKYNFEQLKEIGDLIENHVWITATRKRLFVKQMTTQHIRNCINCWNGKGKLKIPNGYLGGKEKWLRIFQNELTQRQ